MVLAVGDQLSRARLVGARRAVRAVAARRSGSTSTPPSSTPTRPPRSASSATPRPSSTRSRAGCPRARRARRRPPPPQARRRRRGRPALAGRGRRPPRRCVRALDAVLPADRIVAVDSTQPGYAANHALDVELPGSWLMPIGYGCLGSALPMAIGAMPRGARAAGARARRRRRRPLHAPGAGGRPRPRPLAAARRLEQRRLRRDPRRDARSPTCPSWARTHRPSTCPRVAEGFGCIGARAESLDHVAGARRHGARGAGADADRGHAADARSQRHG